jgi:hypothetical protein
VDRSLHELLDMDEANSAVSGTLSRKDQEALLRFVEQRKESDAELRAMAGEFKAALQSLTAYEQRLEQAYEAGDDETRERIAPFYIRTLFDAGREAEAFEVIGAARRSGLTEPVGFAVIGGALLRHGHFADSARWYTKGLVQHAGNLTGIRLNDLLKDDATSALARGRRMARHALAVAPDHLDELYDQYEAIVAPDEFEDEPHE